MRKYLKPNLYYNFLWDVDPVLLKEKGIRGVILDLDNTLVEWGRDEIDERVRVWLKRARDLSLSFCILSNNFSHRVKKIAFELDIPATTKAIKPFGFAFKKAMLILRTRVEETAVIGDQLFTDILGGNCAGLYTILITPRNGREFIATRLMRRLENRVMRWLGIGKRDGKEEERLIGCNEGITEGNGEGCQDG